ncbi:helix-turn-helix transcriptional regulator [Paraburkholderia sp. BR10936]|uniref:helix-turn-helix transcriptional regulator n=1 Tax=Paraburkholderia sp. BR10936 TaxID=3236993 RepID=UPI0034D19216
MNDPLIRRIEAAKYLGVAVPTLDRWAAAGKIARPVKMSARCSGWRQSVLDAFLERFVQSDEPANAQPVEVANAAG